MTYLRKKPDLRGKPFSSQDLKSLARLLKKYGQGSFDDACHKVTTMESRAPGRGRHTDQNLYIVYYSLHQSVEEIGIEKTCRALHELVESITGEQYTAGGLKTLYRRASQWIDSNPEFARRAKLFEDLRSGRERPLNVIGDEILAFPNGPIIPVLVKRK